MEQDIEELAALELSARAYRVVINAGCRSVEDIRKHGREGFMREPNCGAVTLQEIGAAIGDWGQPVPRSDQAHTDALADLVMQLMRLVDLWFEAGRRRR